jgi:hypothetical protein
MMAHVAMLIEHSKPKTVLSTLAVSALLFGCQTQMQAGTAMPDDLCTNPVFVTSQPNGGWGNGGYYVHNNMWHASSGETLYACAYNHWHVTATFPDTTDVKTYPNVHKDINHLKGEPLNHYRAIDSTFGATAPRFGIYDVAYDIWFNGVGSGHGATEFMIWTQNHKQTPLGRLQTRVAFSGVTYDAYHYVRRGANVITLIPTGIITTGTLNLKAMFDWAIRKGWMPSNPTINQVCYGVEICSTEDRPATFYFTNFSLTMN